MNPPPATKHATYHASPRRHVGSERRRLLARILGVSGEALLTLGVVLFLFVVWELWWTDIGASHRQRTLVEDLDWAVPVIVAPGQSPTLVSPHTEAPVYHVVAESRKERVEQPPSLMYPAVAETFATMYVPRWGFDYIQPISEGVNRRKVLDRLGIGHYPETALPGEWGNFAIAGHRTTFGEPFSRIEELQIGDSIVVRTEDIWYVYRVTETEIVRPWFGAAIAPVPGDAAASANGRYITLTTCHPRFSAKYRYVVYGVLDYWAWASAGIPPEIVPTGATMVEDLGTDPEGTSA